ncbi:MAG: EamA family transporter [Aestuariivirgaceae bacterium]|nr:EamA family transporter [Aestuariivirgaceae bacterium]
MTSLVFFSVIAAAAMHAGWNALVKVALDRLRAMFLLTLCMGFLSLAALPFLAAPHPDSWGYLVASGLLHAGYMIFLIKAYEIGDLAQIYPLARGTAPMLSTLAAWFFAGEALTPIMAAGIAMVLSGIYVMGMHGSGRGQARLSGKAVIFALTTSLFISAYTITDGLGVRLSQSSSGYTAWVFVLDMVTMAIAVSIWRGRSAFQNIAPHIGKGMFAGALSLGSYWIALWAMTQAPIGAVAALRETSILFALLISTLFLKEPFTAWRGAAAALIVAGAAALRFS